MDRNVIKIVIVVALLAVSLGCHYCVRSRLRAVFVSVIVSTAGFLLALHLIKPINVPRVALNLAAGVALSSAAISFLVGMFLPWSRWRGDSSGASLPQASARQAELPAGRAGTEGSIIESLRTAEVVLLAVPPGQEGGLAADSLTPDKLASLIESAAETAGAEELRLFYRDRDGRRYLPVFTSEKTAEAYVADLSAAANRVYPLVTSRIPASALHDLARTCETFVFDPGTPHEYRLPADKLRD